MVEEKLALVGNLHESSESEDAGAAFQGVKRSERFVHEFGVEDSFALTRCLNLKERRLGVSDQITSFGDELGNELLGLLWRETEGSEWIVVMEFVEGRVFWDPTMPELDRDKRHEAYRQMADTMARLHQFDVAEIGRAAHDMLRGSKILVPFSALDEAKALMEGTWGTAEDLEETA